MDILNMKFLEAFSLKKPVYLLEINHKLFFTFFWFPASFQPTENLEKNSEFLYAFLLD